MRNGFWTEIMGLPSNCACRPAIRPFSWTILWRVCLDGIRERRGKVREDMPWVEGQEEDADFLAFIRAYPIQSHPKVLELLARYSEKETHIFRDRSEAGAFLEML